MLLPAGAAVNFCEIIIREPRRWQGKYTEAELCTTEQLSKGAGWRFSRRRPCNPAWLLQIQRAPFVTRAFAVVRKAGGRANSVVCLALASSKAAGAIAPCLLNCSNSFSRANAQRTQTFSSPGGCEQARVFQCAALPRWEKNRTQNQIYILGAGARTRFVCEADFFCVRGVSFLFCSFLGFMHNGSKIENQVCIAEGWNV